MRLSGTLGWQMHSYKYHARKDTELYILGGYRTFICYQFLSQYQVQITSDRANMFTIKIAIKQIIIDYELLEIIMWIYSPIWNRISSAVLRQATYGTIKFGTYYSLKKVATDKWGTDDLVLINIVCAAVAGAFSSAIANPTDVVKVRMQVRGVEANVSLLSCFQEVYRNEGVRGLWRVNKNSF